MSEKTAMVVDDMFFASKIRGAASTAGRETLSIKSLDQLDLTDPPSLVLIDLHSQRLDAVSAIEFIRSQPRLNAVPVVAFFSHVEVELKRRAEEAGADYVIPRSLFTEMLPQIVAGDLSSLKAARS